MRLTTQNFFDII